MSENIPPQPPPIRREQVVRTIKDELDAPLAATFRDFVEENKKVPPLRKSRSIQPDKCELDNVNPSRIVTFVPSLQRNAAVCLACYQTIRVQTQTQTQNTQP